RQSTMLSFPIELACSGQSASNRAGIRSLPRVGPGADVEAEAALAGLLVDGRGKTEVLERRAHRLEEGNLLGILAAGPTAADQLPQLDQVFGLLRPASNGRRAVARLEDVLAVVDADHVRAPPDFRVQLARLGP